jgi:hypothetical protein
MWPPADWLDGVIMEAIAEFVRGGSLSIEGGSSLEFRVWCDDGPLMEKKVELADALAEAITDGDNLPSLRAILVAAIDHLDETLRQNPHWADTTSAAEPHKD